MWDFPGGQVAKSLRSSVRDASSIPGQGIRIPHAAGQRGPGTVTSGSLQVTRKTERSQKKKREEDACHDAIQELRQASRLRAVGAPPSQKGTQGLWEPGTGALTRFF